MKALAGWAIVLTSIGIAGFYMRQAAPTLTIGDSAELAAVGGTLGIAHSPGYPLYSIVTRLGCSLLPWGHIAYRTNLQSALWTAASVGLIGWCAWEVTASLAVAIAMMILIAAGSLWMRQALFTEVFALNSFFASLLLLLAIKPAAPGRAYLSSYVLGLGIGNNHTLVLLVPALVVAFWPAPHEKRWRHVAVSFVWFMAGLSIYCFVPLRAYRLPLMDWEEPTTWERFWKLFTRARYGSFQLAQGAVPQITIADIVTQGRYILSACWENFGPWVVFLLAGVAAVKRKECRRSIICLLTAFFVSSLFFFVWTHIGVTARSRFILDRFMYLPLVSACILMAWGFRVVRQGLNKVRMPGAALSAVLVLGGLFWIYSETLPYERSNYYVLDFGKDLLHNTPPRTLLFADRADEAEFVLSYLQRVERQRLDVQFVDCNAGVSTSIYGPGYYDVWGRPRLAIRTAEERQRSAAWEGPVYYATYDPQMIPLQRIQEGLLFAVPKKGFRRRTIFWQEVFHYRRPPREKGRQISWDRGMYSGYLNLLAQDAYLSNSVQRYMELNHGSSLHLNP